MLNVGDYIYIEPLKYGIIYDKNKKSYKITEITTETKQKNASYGWGTGGVNTTTQNEYIYHVTNDKGEKIQIKEDPQKMVPQVLIDGINISEFNLDGKEIIEIKADEGSNDFVEGEGYVNQFPDRCAIIWSDLTKTYGKITKKPGLNNYELSLNYETIPTAVQLNTSKQNYPNVEIASGGTYYPSATANYVPLGKKLGGKRKSRRNRKSRQNRKRKSRQSRRH